MEIKAIRELDEAGREAKLGELRQELFNLRFQHATAQLENTQRIKAVKKGIARILTVKNDKKA